ncbi:MAG: hypothetical protein U0411_13970 [Thermodesulfovibrionales bacterium]
MRFFKSLKKRSRRRAGRAAAGRRLDAAMPPEAERVALRSSKPWQNSTSVAEYPIGLAYIDYLVSPSLEPEDRKIPSTSNKPKGC